MKPHLIDGTYELFRHHFGAEPRQNAKGTEVGAARGVVDYVIRMLETNRYVGVATDKVVESFRNDLWPGYKTSEGMPPELLAQFPILDEALAVIGVCVWPMVEFEADDALAAAAVALAGFSEVEQVVIGTPDKDLTQVVSGDRIVTYNSRQRTYTNEAGVIEKFGIGPDSIPDYLGLVGDSADGFPGLAGWGAKSASLVLAQYPRLEDIPLSASMWRVKVRSAEKLAQTLSDNLDLAYLFRQIATVRTDSLADVTPNTVKWAKPSNELGLLASTLDMPNLQKRIEALEAQP